MSVARCQGERIDQGNLPAHESFKGSRCPIAARAVWMRSRLGGLYVAYYCILHRTRLHASILGFADLPRTAKTPIVKDT